MSRKDRLGRHAACEFLGTLMQTYRGTAMSNHVYKQVELVGSSTQSSDDAIARAIERAHATLRNVEWFQVTETRGHVVDGKVAHWQVGLKIGLRVEEA